MSEGLSREGFDVDLRYGEAREDAFVHSLLRSRVEVKSDRKCQVTGNLCVEFAQKGRPSGIATTTADRWAFEYAPDCWLVVPTDKLRALARRAYRDGHVVKAGDYDRYDCVLIPVVWVVQAWRSAE